METNSVILIVFIIGAVAVFWAWLWWNIREPKP